jgi:S-adenosylmethionine:tRNA ribosyltransferase-isomerase
MRPAHTYPERRDDVRLLVVDPLAGAFRETRTPALPALLAPGDLLVVNDAAVLPASLRGEDAAGRPVEARLVAARGGPRFVAVLFGAGDWRQRTEDRPPPAEAAPGARLRFGALGAEVAARSARSPRLVELRFDVEGAALWAALYREGRPVQYSYLAHELPLWAVQTVYAGRPWAFEMPSAGRPLSWEILLVLRRKGVRWAALTHAAGPSSTGDSALDAALPLPERYDIPATTVAAIARARAGGGRVVAVGTTVVRALEGAAARGGPLRAGAGETDLRITPAHRPRIVDGVLSGTHAAAESHFALLGAFAGAELLARASGYADEQGFLTHELGDATLVLPGALAAPELAGRWQPPAARGLSQGQGGLVAPGVP